MAEPQELGQLEAVAARAPVFAKFQYIRSKALLRVCRELPCQHCGAQDGTVVAAHSNQAKHGKGRGIKASDQYVAALCYRCHWDVDQSGLDRETKGVIWSGAHASTVRELLRRGLWPAEVPVPEV